VVVGSAVLVTVWLSVGVVGVVVGLLLLRASMRSRSDARESALVLPHPSTGATGPDAREPDALAG
jgi:hypothetical protein